MLTYYSSQNCIDGLDNIDAHIGGDELHLKCYNILQEKWLAWSKGYTIPIERTTLQGAKIIAAIAGKDLLEPVKKHDVMWHFFFKARQGNEPKFKAEQLQLAVIIDYEDFADVELRKEDAEELDGVTTLTGMDTRRKPKKMSGKLAYANTLDFEDSVAVTSGQAGPVSDSEPSLVSPQYYGICTITF